MDLLQRTSNPHSPSDPTPERTLELEKLREDYARDGYLVLPRMIGPDELAALQEDTALLIEEGRSRRGDDDYFFDTTLDGTPRLHRVQYIFPKSPKHRSLLTLLAHPRILEIAETLLGPDFLCAGEALVFKEPGFGLEVPVHADCFPADPNLGDDHRFFNVDVYLDPSTPENGCLYAAPGSHAIGDPWPEIWKHGFEYPGLTPIPVEAGDVIVHDCRLVHGSPTSRANRLRRTVYLEFHRREHVLRDGMPPGVKQPASWADNRARILMRAIDERKKQPWAKGEESVPYRAPEGLAWPDGDDGIDYRPRLGVNQYY